MTALSAFIKSNAESNELDLIILAAASTARRIREVCSRIGIDSANLPEDDAALTEEHRRRFAAARSAEPPLALVSANTNSVLSADPVAASRKQLLATREALEARWAR